MEELVTTTIHKPQLKDLKMINPFKNQNRMRFQKLSKTSEALKKSKGSHIGRVYFTAITFAKVTGI